MESFAFSQVVTKEDAVGAVGREIPGLAVMELNKMQAGAVKISVVPDSAIFEHFGRLAFSIQLFDFSLANVLNQVFGPGPDQRSRSQVREDIEKLYRCTTGQLAGKLRTVLGQDDPLVKRITAAVKQRNYFIHHFFRETASSARTDHGRRAMLESMKAAEDLFSQLDDELTEVYGRWLASHGVDINSL